MSTIIQHVYTDAYLVIKVDGLVYRYSNNHMGYFATPNEYEVGGYESLLTMWGEFTAERMRESCKKVAEQVKPS
jgi:hypothetical protein